MRTYLVVRSKENEYQYIREFSNKLIAKALEMDGTITGEHGIGLQKKEYLLKQHPDNIPLMKLIKKIFLYFYDRFFIKLLALLYFPLSIVLFILKFRFIIIDWNNAIGHIIGEPDMFLREEYLNKLKKKKNFLLINEKEIANKSSNTKLEGLPFQVEKKI